MNAEEYARALAGLPIGPLRFYATIGSTNDEMARWCDHGAPDLALVIADEQTAGRGRRGRRWHTPPQTSLAFSLLLRDATLLLNRDLDIAAQARAFPTARLTGMGALAVAQALERTYGLAAQIKWPNDVLLPTSQAPGVGKAAGILVEAHWQGENPSGIILGIGVNIKPQAIPPEARWLFPPTCVETALGQQVERTHLLHAILARLLAWRRHLHSASLLAEWQARLAYQGEQVAIYTDPSPAAKPAFQGTLLGLDDQGNIQLQLEEGKTIRIQNGEIRLRPKRKTKQHR